MRMLSVVLVGALLLAGCTSYSGPEGEPTPYVPVASRTSTTTTTSGCGTTCSTTTSTTTTTASAPQAPVPVYQVGDFWTKRVYSAGATANRTETVQAIESVTLNGTAYQAYRVKTVAVNMNATTWVRVSDLALLKSEGDFADLHALVVYDAPCTILHFPLRVGMNWSYNCASTTTITGGVKTTIRSSEQGTVNVTKDQLVTTPAGTFSSFELRQTETTTTEGRTDAPQIAVAYYAAAACTHVQELDSDGHKTSELLLYRCGAK